MSRVLTLADSSAVIDRPQFAQYMGPPFVGGRAARAGDEVAGVIVVAAVTGDDVLGSPAAAEVHRSGVGQLGVVHGQVRLRV
jgi:hypothetical protein